MPGIKDIHYHVQLFFYFKHHYLKSRKLKVILQAQINQTPKLYNLVNFYTFRVATGDGSYGTSNWILYFLY